MIQQETCLFKMRTEEHFAEQRIRESLLPQALQQAPSKTSIQPLVDKIMQSIDEGKTDSGELATQIAYLEAVFKALKEPLKETLLNDMKGAEMNRFGTKIEEIEAATKYDYSGCGHPVWERYDQAEKSANNSKKEIEATLKTLKSSITFVDDETGEVVSVAPPKKTSVTTYKITLAK